MDERNPNYVTPEEAEEKICINIHRHCVGSGMVPMMPVLGRMPE